MTLRSSTLKQTQNKTIDDSVKREAAFNRSHQTFADYHHPAQHNKYQEN
jgi:hypothetical protein